MNLVIKHDIFIFVMARSLLGKCMWKYSTRIEKSFQLSLKFLLMLHCFIFFFWVICACIGKILLVFLCFQVHHGGAGTTAAGLRAAVILMAIF